MLFFSKVPRNALERHLQVDIETHLNLACEKLQILENESIITDQRLEELERFATSHHHLEELHTAISDKMKRIDELERSMQKTSQLQIRTNEKLDLLEAVLTGIESEKEQRDEMILNTQSIQQALEREIEAIKRKLQELPSTAGVGTDRELQPGASRFNRGLRLPSLLTPTAPPLPRPAGLPERRRIISGAVQLPSTMDDGNSIMNEQRWQECSGTDPPCPQELSTAAHISNRFIWKFTQFDDCLQKAKNGSRTFYLSNPFQRGPYGYKMCLEFHPNGLNEGWNTHLSIFVCLMKSEYDDILPWPFNSKVMITLIDQQSNPRLRRNIQMSSLPRNNQVHLSVCYSKPEEARPRNVAFGFCKFTTQERLKTRRYLVNDTLFLCVEVDRLNSVLQD